MLLPKNNSQPSFIKDQRDYGGNKNLVIEETKLFSGRDSSLFSLQNDAKLVFFFAANSTLNKCFLDSGKSVQTFLQMGRSVLSLIGKKIPFSSRDRPFSCVCAGNYVAL